MSLVIAATKGIFGIGAATAVVGAGYHYFDDIKNWWDISYKDFLVQVTSESAQVKDNYSCFSTVSEKENEPIECFIFSIEIGSNRYVNTNSLNRENKNIKKVDAKTQLTKNSYYLLRLNVSKWDKKDAFDGTSKLTIKPAAFENKFADLKVIAALGEKERAGEKIKENTGKLEHFIAKIGNIKKGSTTPDPQTFTFDASKAFQCHFVNKEDDDESNGSTNTSEKLNCEIYKFHENVVTTKNSNEGGGTSIPSKIEDLTITGTITKLSTETVKEYEYLLIKFTTSVDANKFENKEIIYAETGTGEDKYSIKFVDINQTVIQDSDGKKAFIIIN